MFTAASAVAWIVAAALDWVTPMWAVTLGGPMCFLMLAVDTARGSED